MEATLDFLPAMTLSVARTDIPELESAIRLPVARIARFPTLSTPVALSVARMANLDVELPSIVLN